MATSRAVAIKAAQQGKLSLWQAFKANSLDVWANDHKKFFAVLISIAGEILNAGLVHGNLQLILSIVIGALGVGGVNLLPNTKPKVEK